MPCHTRMKSIFLRALLWLYLLELGFMLVSPEPGYLDFDNLPDTNFSCAWRIVGGYYADVEVACQMFHVCTLGQNNETMDIRFLCLNGTVFDQSTRVCERIDEVDCEKSEQYYDNNRELYGNSAPLIIPGEEVTQPPSTTTTTTTTTTSRPKYYSTATPRRANTPHYYTTAKSNPTPTLQKLALHHHQFSSDSPPDFRFNPKEINLKLNSDSSLDIKPISYQQHRFNDEKNQHTIVTTHSYTKDDGKHKKNVEVSYDFDYQDDKNYPQNYQSTGTGAEEEYEDDYKHEESSTTRIVSTPPTHQGYHFQRSDRPPVNPPLVYSALSTPTPFAHNTGNKRHSDPKIKKSVSVSISDQNGKELVKLNNTPISAIFSDSYLDYSEEEVTLLPLFEDVPKVKPTRTKRDIDSELLRKKTFNMTDKEAANILRFLLNWYSDYEKTTKKVTIPLSGETITEINKELSPRSIQSEDSKDDEVTEMLVAKASQTAVEFEKYLEEDYQDYLNSVNNQTSKELNETSPIEYEYYYYYEDDDNITNSKEVNQTNINNIDKNNDTNLIVSTTTQQPKITDSNEIQPSLNESKEVDLKKENPDSNAVEIPLYDYVDDNYEPKTFNKQDIKPRKIDVNEYVDDNYETNKNEVPAEMIKIEKSTTMIPNSESNIEISTKEYFERTKENEIVSKGNVEVTTELIKNQVINNENKEFHLFEESTEKTSLDVTPETTTPMITIKETTTDLSFMIQDIEKHTKSLATNIVMPSHNYSAPVIHTKLEEEIQELKNGKVASTQNEKPENFSFIPTSTEINQSGTSSGRGRGRGRGRNRVVTSTESQITRSSRQRGRGRYGVTPSSSPPNVEETPKESSTVGVILNSTENEKYLEDNATEATILEKNVEVVVEKQEVTKHDMYLENSHLEKSTEPNIKSIDQVEEIENNSKVDLLNKELELNKNASKSRDKQNHDLMNTGSLNEFKNELITSSENPKEILKPYDLDKSVPETITKEGIKIEDQIISSGTEEIRENERNYKDNSSSVENLKTDTNNEKERSEIEMESPAMETTIPIIKTTNPMESTVPTIESKIPTIESTIPTIESTIPTIETTIPTIKTTSSMIKTTNPIDTTTPSMENSLSTTETPHTTIKTKSSTIRSRTRPSRTRNRTTSSTTSSTKSIPFEITTTTTEKEYLISPNDSTTLELTTEESLITTQKLDDDYTILKAISEVDVKELTTLSTITSDVPSSTEEILTTITLPKSEEVDVISTILPEMDPTKPLTDILGYSMFNKLSESADDSLRDLGYFNIPKTETTTKTTSRKYNIRGRGRHRFNIISSTKLPQTESSITQDLSTIDETFTTDGILSTITTTLPYKRKSNHRFSININTEDISTLTTTEPTTLQTNQEIKDDLPITTTLKPIKITSRRVKGRHRFSVIPENITQKLNNKSKDVTDPSLIRSANPTLPRSTFRSTTPITTRVVKVKMRNSKYTFNCLDKEVNKFYSDPRDCRLFHYCSPGYNSNQAVDMKFVCDMGTYYDDIERICTKKRPSRCL